MDECIFCKIARGELPGKVVYRDAEVVAIEDLNPQAPTHLLVMPVEHHDDIVGAAADANLVATMFRVGSKLGNERGGERGFRLVINTGPDGGQTVGHLHVHVLAGRHLSWPPG
jgi:histidine triad (HIT) family protein